MTDNIFFWANLVGYAASVAMICGYIPQAWHTIRTRETDSIAMPTFLLMGLGALLFIVQGVLLDNMPLVITNSVTGLSSAIVFAIKVHNDYFKRKGNES